MLEQNQENLEYQAQMQNKDMFGGQKLNVNYEDIIGFLKHDMDLVDQKVQFPAETELIQNFSGVPKQKTDLEIEAEIETQQLLQQQQQQQVVYENERIEPTQNIFEQPVLSYPNQRKEEYKSNYITGGSTSPGKWSTQSNISTQENPVPTFYTKYEQSSLGAQPQILSTNADVLSGIYSQQQIPQSQNVMDYVSGGGASILNQNIPGSSSTSTGVYSSQGAVTSQYVPGQQYAYPKSEDLSGNVAELDQQMKNDYLESSSVQAQTSGLQNAISGSNQQFSDQILSYKQQNQFFPEELRYGYIHQDIVDHLRDIINLMCTKSAQVNFENRQWLIDQLFNRLRDQKVEGIDKERVGRVLDSLKLQMESNDWSFGDKELFLRRMLATYYKVGFDAYIVNQGKGSIADKTAEELMSVRRFGILFYVQIRDAAWLSKPTWIMLMLCYLADSGLSYRQYQDGTLSADEFRHTASFLSVSKVPSVVGGISGTAVGFVLGSLILPGAGSVIGSVIGGLTGGLLGDRASLSAYQQLEDRINHMRDMKIHESQIDESGEPIRILITNQRYYEALALVGAHDNDSLTSIETKYLDRVREFSEQLWNAKTSNDKLKQEQIKISLNELNRSYKDIRRRKNFSLDSKSQ